MDAMILAAGLGTRLRPLTNEVPKALVEVDERPMLEHAARRLVDAGADRLVVNTHHHAEKVHQFIEEQDGFGVQVAVSHEPEQALGTGGGLAHAAGHFRRDAPFFLYNADILTDLDLRALYDAHQDDPALATLVVRPAETSRHLTFDAAGRLCGYGHPEEDREVFVTEPEGEVARYDFCGIHVIDPRIFDLMTETGVFGLINVYLRLAKQGERIATFPLGDAAWIDVGTHERLEQARQHFGEVG